MFAPAKSKRKASSRFQIAIKGVQDGILMLPGHSYRAVLSVSAINFELRSEAEQDAIISTYESFLNSVNTPLQIIVRTRAIDMDKYLDDLKAQQEQETETIYKQQYGYYDEFIRSLITDNSILTRHFYIVVPLAADNKTDFDAAKERLMQVVDIVQKGLARLGMQSRPLQSLEVLDLFYNFYSPEQAKSQPLTAQALSVLSRMYSHKETT